MSQHPSRPPGGPGGWGGRPSAPSPFRPASPYSPTSSPNPHNRSRGPPTPVHHPHPMSPLTYPHMMHPMSPVPMGMPISPGMSPVFGCPPPGYIQCPRPRWPSPIQPGTSAPRPFIPAQVQSPIGSGSSSPVPCGPPEYLIAPYRPGEYEYVGVPLDPAQGDEEATGPSTAEIIASQSQDYVDEKLAEYQATIQQLQVDRCRT
ncbi:basic proline-rich protein-like [Cephus cinctus]|uniref:Basic proline-rich protein-like n=1 Tax=Cephus cinctus TaxID=211228 RepID=A0AAJ7RM86_CEPCN|nr:basic proline-rich protein-like [Cephus cinctus]